MLSSVFDLYHCFFSREGTTCFWIEITRRICSDIVLCDFVMLQVFRLAQLKCNVFVKRETSCVAIVIYTVKHF